MTLLASDRYQSLLRNVCILSISTPPTTSTSQLYKGMDEVREAVDNLKKEWNQTYSQTQEHAKSIENCGKSEKGTAETNLLPRLNAVAQDGMAILRSLQFKLDLLAQQLPTEEEVESAQAMLKSWKEQYQSLHVALRNANLQAKSNIQKAVQEERALLLGGGEESIILRRNLQTKAGMVSAAESVTESLRRTRQLMVQEVERSANTLVTFAHNFCIAEINDLSASTNIRSNQIEDIILFIYQSDGLSKHMDTLKRILSIAPQDESFCIATNLILTDDISSINYSRQVDFFNKSLDNDFEAILAETEQEISMSDILRELGYGCTFNIAHCKEILSLFTPLNEVTVSKLIATIAPKLNWTCVMENLDHEGFIVPDETTFSLLISIYNKSCQAPFPLHAVCGSVWKNTEGQLSFLRHAVVAPPEIFSFSHCSRPLVNNTNVEGRLTLADVLVYTCNLGVEKVVDLATLTGACVVALGPSIAGGSITAALFLKQGIGLLKRARLDFL